MYDVSIKHRDILQDIYKMNDTIEEKNYKYKNRLLLFYWKSFDSNYFKYFVGLVNCRLQSNRYLHNNMLLNLPRLVCSWSLNAHNLIRKKDFCRLCKRESHYKYEIVNFLTK